MLKEEASAKSAIRKGLFEVGMLRQQDRRYRDEASKAFLLSVEETLTHASNKLAEGVFAEKTALVIAEGCLLALEEDKCAKGIVEGFATPMYRGKVLLQMIRLDSARKSYGRHRLKAFPKQGPLLNLQCNGDLWMTFAAIWVKETYPDAVMPEEYKDFP